MAVPLFDTRTPLAPLRDALAAKAAEVLDAGRYILGPEVAGFERDLAAHLGTDHVVGVANGTDALVLALRGMGVGPGDDVVVPSFTFYASAEAIAVIGANPVFCDIDPETFCVTPDTVRDALTPQTKVVMAVHLFGNVAPVDGLAQLGVPVLEDAAQALGSRVADGRSAGTLGAAAVTECAEVLRREEREGGGAIATADDELAEQVTMLRFHGSRDKVSFELVGHNSRLDELQAGLLALELPHLDAWCDGRRAGAAHYADAGLGALAGLPVPVDGCDPAWHLYVIRHERAEALGAALAEAGIGSKRYYGTPLHRQAAMRPWSDVELPGTDEAARTHLAIPMSPVLGREQADEVVAAVRDADLG